MKMVFVHDLLLETVQNFGSENQRWTTLVVGACEILHRLVDSLYYP